MSKRERERALARINRYAAKPTTSAMADVVRRARRAVSAGKGHARHIDMLQRMVARRA